MIYTSDGRIIVDTEINNSGIEKGVKGIGGVAKTGLKLFAGAVVGIGAAIGGIGIAGIKLASDLGEVQNVVDTTFGSNAGAINTWAKNAATSFGIGELAAKQMTGTMGAMLKSMGMSAPETLKMSEGITGLAGDLASFYNIDTKDAFEKIRSGIAGETKPLKELGINMSVANLSAYALAKGISKPYAKMTQGEQTTLRYNYLMKVTKDQQGDFAKTSNSLANQMRIASLNVKSLCADLGKLLLPIAQKAVQSFNEIAKKLKVAFQSEEVKASIQSIAKGISALVTGLATLIVDWLPKIISGFAWLLTNANNIAAGIVSIGTAFSVLKGASIITGIVNAFKDAQAILPGLTVAQWLYNAAMAACGGPIILIVALIVGLVAGLIYLWKTNEGFRNAVIGVWNSIVNAVVSVVTAVVNFVQNNWKQLLLFLVNPIAGALALIYNLNPQFKAWVNGLWVSISTGFMNILNAIIAWGASVVTWVTTNIPLIVNNIVTFFAGLPTMIGTFFTNIYNGFITWGASVIAFFATIFTNVLTAIVNWGLGIIAWVTTNIPLIITSITTFFDQLPYRIGYALGFALGTIIAWGVGIWTYLVTNVPIWINGVVTFFSQLPGRIWAWLVSAYTNIVTWGSQVYTSMVTKVSNVVNAVVAWFAQLPGRIWACLVNAYTRIVAWGSQTYASMSSAVSRAINAVVAWFSQLPGRIWSCLSSAIARVVAWGSQVYSSMSSAVSRAISAVINWFSQLPGRIGSCLSNTLSRVAQFGSNLASRAAQAGANMASSLISAVSSIPGQMASVGSNIVQGIWNGITGMAGWLASKVKSFASGIVAGIKGALDIRSPSRVMRDEVGKYIPQGVGVGIDDEMPNLQKKINSNMSNLTAKMQATIGYETANTTAKVVALHNYSSDSTSTTASETGSNNNNQTIVTKFIVDGKEFVQSVVAPHQEELTNYSKGR